MHLRLLILEPLVQLFHIAEGVPALFIAVGMEYRDQVEQLAAAQRIMHQMRLGPGPEHDIILELARRHLAGRQHGAIGDMARDARLAVVDDPGADLRPQAVADECLLEPRCGVRAGFHRTDVRADALAQARAQFLCPRCIAACAFFDNALHCGDRERDARSLDALEIERRKQSPA